MKELDTLTPPVTYAFAQLADGNNSPEFLKIDDWNLQCAVQNQIRCLFQSRARKKGVAFIDCEILRFAAQSELRRHEIHCGRWTVDTNDQDRVRMCGTSKEWITQQIDFAWLRIAGWHDS